MRILFSLLLILVSCCDDEDKNNLSNPTNGKTAARFNPNSIYGIMIDQDGNYYKTIEIGTQTWMAENLRTTKYRNGDAIPEVANRGEWSLLNSGAYCNYQNTKNIDTIATFGRLYNWYTLADTRNIAPNGWHVPTDDEWKELVSYLGDAINIGGMLKEIDTTHWHSPNELATNLTGFTALPGGYRSVPGYYYNLDFYGYWWASTDTNSLEACYRGLTYKYPLIYGDYNDFLNKNNGLSLRCIKD